MSLSTGDVIDGKYRIVRLIGEGGMGAVYEGENVKIHRRVAIKVLHAGVAENQDAVQRFEREAQAAGRIGSEHIVEVLDLGNLESGDRYMVMEFMDGDSLSGRIQGRGRLTAQETYPIARQILEGLNSAHSAGIIHRDLKPDNVYLLKSRGGQADFVKLLDFGISKFSALSGESGFSMTRTGAVMGTPYYMSPEQAKGAKGMDHRADLYAVGVILYECITGRVPFNADTFNELLFKIVLETPEPISQVVTDCDPDFEALVGKAMAREPAHRFQSSAEFQAALDQWASGKGVSATVSRVGAGPVAVAAPAADAARPTSMGTPGVWANTPAPAAAPAEAAQGPAKKSGPPVAAIAAAALVVLGAGGFLVSRGGKAEPPPVAPAAQPAGPSLEEVKAAAAEAAAAEAKKVTDEKLKKAEEDARAAEARARAAEESQKARAEEDARAAQERVARTRPVAGAKPAAGKPGPAPAPAPAPAPQSGRKIRTDL